MNRAFQMVFEKALTKRAAEPELLLQKATEFIDKGYPSQEIIATLKHMYTAYIDPVDCAQIQEVYEFLEVAYP